MTNNKPTKCDCPAEYAIGVEYCGTPHDYDGVSEWKCEQCKRRWGRWSGRELAEGELEPRYGDRLEALKQLQTEAQEDGEYE